MVSSRQYSTTKHAKPGTLKCRTWQFRTWHRRTKWQGWKMQDLAMTDQLLEAFGRQLWVSSVAAMATVWAVEAANDVTRTSSATNRVEAPHDIRPSSVLNTAQWRTAFVLWCRPTFSFLRRFKYSKYPCLWTFRSQNSYVLKTTCSVSVRSCIFSLPQSASGSHAHDYD